MPKLKDWTWQYTTSTTGTTIACDLPDYDAGNLLVAILSADTGTQTWTSTGWTTLISKTNTSNLAVLYKIAGASETAPTFTASVAESFNARLLSIEDVNTTTPFPTMWYGKGDHFQESQTSLNATITRVGQSFNGDGAIISGARFKMRKVGVPTANMTATITSHSGTYGTSSVATTTIYATSTAIASSTLTTAWQWVDFTFPTPYTTAANTLYSIVINFTGTATNYVDVATATSTDAKRAGNMSTYSGATWTAVANSDLLHFVRNTKGYATEITALTSQYIPDIMADTLNNCLFLNVTANSGLGVPQVIEGPIMMEEGSDGTAHSDSLSWGFLPKLKQSNLQPMLYTTASATAAAIITIVVAPPALAGATIIPPYCSSDLSEYIDPMNGTTAYDGNTAFAATATTYFSTSLNGKTLANGTAAAVTDVGINSFHSLAQLTGSVTNGTWAGATTVLSTANKPNVTGKNVLCHVKPSSPKVYQTTDMITKIGTKGVAFGMCSTANSAYKVWHVHGNGTSWNGSQHIPIVINANATKGLIQNTGSLNPASILSFGFFTSGRVVAPVFQFGSLWALDKTTIAGGNSTIPVGTYGIWSICSRGKERMSVIQQGSGQLLVLQPIQFGDGGSSPLNLNLDSTAIEFPEQYNLDSKSVFYCSEDNAVGLTYYAGSNDVIKHTNAVVSSLSPFYWNVHASSSVSASYDFSGLTIIGAGLVTFQPVTVFSNMTFTKCFDTRQSSATLTNCNFIDSKITANNPNIITNCNFTRSTGTVYAMTISTPGTYTLNNVFFNNYGATGTTSAAIYNISSGSVTLNITGGNIPSYYNAASSTTTIVSSANVELTGLKPGSEVRAYLGEDPATATEIGGIETSETTFSFVQLYSGQSGFIMIHALGYITIRLPIVYGSADVSIPIQQQIDRVYNNPA